MEKKCLYCRKVLVDKRPQAKYCDDVCKSMNWKSTKRLKKIKEETKWMLDKDNVQVSSEVEELYKKIFGG